MQHPLRNTFLDVIYRFDASHPLQQSACPSRGMPSKSDAMQHPLRKTFLDVIYRFDASPSTATVSMPKSGHAQHAQHAQSGHAQVGAC